jgi:lysophospholipase L1-like esterase
MSIVDSLRDISGNNRPAWQTTGANKPTYVASGGLNNRSYIQFNTASPSKMTSGTMTLDTNLSFYFLFRMDENYGPFGKFLLGTSCGSCFNIGNNWVNFNNNGQEVSAAGGLMGYVLIEWHRIGRVATMYMNGVKMPFQSNSVTTNPFNWAGIGGNIGSGSQFPEFSFHELICYNVKQTEWQQINIRNYLIGKYGIKAGAIVGFGDSYVTGSQPIASVRLRWLTRLAGYMGMSEISQGISGTELESPVSPGTNNGYDRRYAIPFANPGGYIVIMYGGNDANSVLLTKYNPKLYKVQLGTVVNDLIEKKGWRRDQIIIVPQPIFSPAFLAGRQARWDSFHTAQLEVVKEMNVMLSDQKTYFGTNVATNASIGGDGTHYTDTQNDTSARLIRAAIYAGWNKDSVVLVSGSWRWLVSNALPYVFTGSTSTWTLPPVINNSGGVIRIKNRGSGNITLNSFDGGNDIYQTSAAATLTIAPGGEYTFRNDGTYWTTAPAISLVFSTGLTLTGSTVTNDVLTGIAGGQTWVGGTAANEDVTIRGTTNATKTTSYVLLQDNGGFTGVGTTAPIGTLHVRASTDVVPCGVFDNGSTTPPITFNTYPANYSQLQANANFDGSYKYVKTAPATMYRLLDGSGTGGNHVWETAPSGTAGAAITFTQRMKLYQNGLFTVGTSDNFSVNSSGVITEYNNAVPSNGQLLIGNGTNFAAATVTAGSGISVTNGAGSVTVATTTLTNTGTLDFGNTGAQLSADLTITVTGAAVGDAVSVGIPAADANSSYSAFVSATNTVTVRFNNYSSGSIDPASGVFTVKVFK